MCVLLKFLLDILTEQSRIRSQMIIATLRSYFNRMTERGESPSIMGAADR